jgi:hypothetical protein
MLRDAKEKELERARIEGNFGWAAQLQAEIADLDSSRLQRIREEREVVNQVLRSLLAAELEAQAERLEACVPEQQAKEAKALSQLERVSGSGWAPKKDASFPAMDAPGGATRGFGRPAS